jgi:hypothetical protein
MDIEEVKKERDYLENNMLVALRNFEEKTGVLAKDISLIRVYDVGNRNGDLVSVEISIAL